MLEIVRMRTKPDKIGLLPLCLLRPNCLQAITIGGDAVRDSCSKGAVGGIA